MAVPMSIAGWGPREGVAAWSFGLAGLGAQQGISAAVVYGVLVLVASLPGAVVLLAWSLAPGLRRLGHG
jgi:bacteriorhodopsin